MLLPKVSAFSLEKTAINVMFFDIKSTLGSGLNSFGGGNVDYL